MYRLSLKFALTCSRDRKYPGAISLLYDSLDLFCTQCGLRLSSSSVDPQGAVGKQKMEAHLDWHFRQNKKLRERSEATARIAPRGWYPSLNEWLLENEVDAPSLINDQDNANNSSEDELEFSELKESSENIPVEESLSTVKCVICLENLDKFYDEDLEEWMLRGAIKINDIVRILFFFSFRDTGFCVEWYSIWKMDNSLLPIQMLFKKSSTTERVGSINRNRFF